MKRSAIVAMLALVALPFAAQAQTGTINATATVATVLTFGASSAVSFGSITPNTAATASGYITLQRNVGVIFTLPDAANTGRLTGPAGFVSPSYTCGIGTTTTTITSAFSSCVPATGTTGVLTLAAPTGVTTEYVIFNGSLTAAQTNIAPGSYTGTINIVATAN